MEPGLRHNFGPFNASVAYTNVYSKNQLTWTCGIKDCERATATSARARPRARASASRSSPAAKEAWFNSVQVSLDKPFTSSSKWAATFSYVYGDAKQTGNDLFSFGRPRPGVRHQAAEPARAEAPITASAIVGLPFEFRVRHAHQPRLGLPVLRQRLLGRLLDSASRTSAAAIRRSGPRASTSASRRTSLSAAPTRVGVFAEVINVFNFTNEQGYDGCIPALPDVNTNYGMPNSAYNPRRVQFGVNFDF